MKLEQENYYCVVLIEEPIYTFNLFALNDEDAYKFVKDKFESNFYFVNFKDLGNVEKLDDFLKTKNKEDVLNELKNIDNIYNYFEKNTKEENIMMTEKFEELIQK